MQYSWSITLINQRKYQIMFSIDTTQVFYPIFKFNQRNVISIC